MGPAVIKELDGDLARMVCVERNYNSRLFFHLLIILRDSDYFCRYACFTSSFEAWILSRMT